ncbi:GHMP kinase [uncultured Croceitalea sp.]|uniref:GHMP family kinase ATP-binding protein n=1 Tax=uncultured Croceitalea sp. TaxID=1798908 RepID=UPI0033056797
MVNIKVPARICFYGDHQDYLGLPVIAGTINRFIELRAVKNSTNSFVIKLLDLDKKISILVDDALDDIKDGDYFRSCMAVLKENGFVFDQGYNIEISGNIPVNAGLSSSSALVVCWLRFLIAIQEKSISVSDEEIGQLAYKAETVYFKQPGGIMDQYTIAQGGMLFIDTETGESSVLHTYIGTLVIAESGIAKQTLEVLQNARVYAQNAIASVQKSIPDFKVTDATIADYEKYKVLVPDEFQNHWYATIHNYVITRKAQQELQKSKPDTTVLGNLMNQHQQILQDQIQNTPIEMIKMLESAKEAGALGAKIIGSGGGGCMVAITDNETKNKVINAFLASNALNAYEVKLV